MAYENIINIAELANSIGFFALAICAIFASSYIGKQKKSLSQITIYSSILAVITLIIGVFLFNPTIDLIRIISFLVMFVSSIFVWNTLKKYKNPNEKRMAFWLLVFILSQVVAPFISAFFKTLANY